ncbi:MAG: hypothetical protein WDA17_01000 [Sphaerochaetaceae bacterium]|jgi:hypothetical protein
MKKRVLILIIISLLVPATLFAGLINLNVGATAQYKIPTIGDSEDLEDAANIENWAFGPDIRLRLLFAEVGVAGLYSKTEDGHTLSGVLTGGISLDLLGFLRVGLGLGPRMEVLFDEDFKNPEVLIAGGSIDDATFGDAFMNAPMTYRATADFKLGRFLVGLNYTIDSNGFTFADPDTEKLLPDFENNPGRVGVSLLFRLF